MLITNLNSLFGQSPMLAIERREYTTPVVTEEKIVGSPKVLMGKYDTDIEGLRTKWPNLLTGVCIEVMLQEMLSICPRKRQRIEAYNGLVGYLRDYYGTTLTIKSRKTK